MMQSGKIMGFFAAILLAACHPSTSNHATPVPQVSPANNNTSVCPSQDFSSFLSAFMEDIALQKTFTRYPYKTTLYDPQDLEADPKVQQLTADQVGFPIVLDASDMAEQGVKLHSQKKADDWYEVSTQSEGTGANTMTFNFKYLRGCWFLTDAVDAST